MVDAAQVLGLRILGAISLFVFGILIARMLGVDRFGVFYLALTIATIAGALGILGTDQSGLRAIASAWSRGDTDKVHSIYNGSLRVILGTSLVLTVLLGLSSSWLANSLLSEKRLLAPLLILAVSVPAYALATFHSGALRAVGRTKSSILILQNLTYLVGIAILLVYHFGLHGSSLITVATIYSLSVYATLATAIWLWYKYMGLRRVALSGSIRQIIRTSLPFFWITGVALAFDWVDILMLGILANSHAVGIYTAANRIAKLITFILFAVNMIVAPTIASLYSKRKFAELKTLAHGSTLLTIAATVPIALIIVLFPSFLLGLFGQGFRDGTTTLIILALGQAVNAFTGAVALLLAMTQYEKQLRNIMFAAVILDGLIDYILIPHLGITGAAIGSTAGMSFLNICAVIVAQRKLGFSTLPLPHIRKKGLQA